MLHANKIVLHVDMNKSHVNINMLQVNIMYLACMGQKNCDACIHNITAQTRITSQFWAESIYD